MLSECGEKSGVDWENFGKIGFHTLRTSSSCLFISAVTSPCFHALILCRWSCWQAFPGVQFQGGWHIVGQCQNLKVSVACCGTQSGIVFEWAMPSQDSSKCSGSGVIANQREVTLWCETMLAQPFEHANSKTVHLVV